MSGIGKRFMDDGYTLPKPLILVDNKPMIEHVISLFPGESEYIFICNRKHLIDTNMRTVLNRIVPNCSILEVSNLGYGPVHAISLVWDEISDIMDDEIIVSYCDYGTEWDYESFKRDVRTRNADGAIACYKGFHPHMLGTDNYAFLRDDGNRWMLEIQEKQPFTCNRMEEYASNGTYYFKTGNIMKKYFTELMKKELMVNNEYYVSLSYNLMVKDGLKVSIYEIDKMLQWGTPHDLKLYQSWLEYFYNLDHNSPLQFIDKWNTTTVMALAGAGSRFTKVGYNLPKPLLMVDNKPMFMAALESLPRSSHNILVCLSKYHEVVRGQIDSNDTVIGIDKVTQGQACTVELALKGTNFDLQLPILISACDNGVYYNVNKYQILVDNPEIDVIVWTFRNNSASAHNPNMYAWLQVDEDDNILNVSCKKFDPELHNVKTSHVIIGTMFFRKAQYFMDGLSSNYRQDVKTNNEYYVDDVLNQNIIAGLKLKVFEVTNYLCWGTPNDYKTYNYWNEHFRSTLLHVK